MKRKPEDIDHTEEGDTHGLVSAEGEKDALDLFDAWLFEWSTSYCDETIDPFWKPSFPLIFQDHTAAVDTAKMYHIFDMVTDTIR